MVGPCEWNPGCKVDRRGEIVVMHTRLFVRHLFALGLVVAIPAVLCGCDGGPENRSEAAERTVSVKVPESRSPEAQAILDVLIHDAAPSKEEWTAETSAVEQTRYIVGTMKSIRLGACPEEFRAAYEAHLRAWQKELRFLMDHSDEIETLGDWSKLIALEGTEARSNLERQAFERLAEVRETFLECVRIAEQYGVSEAEYSSSP
jgi:hypothetical protein